MRVKSKIKEDSHPHILLFFASCTPPFMKKKFLNYLYFLEETKMKKNMKWIITSLLIIITMMTLLVIGNEKIKHIIPVNTVTVLTPTFFFNCIFLIIKSFLNFIIDKMVLDNY